MNNILNKKEALKREINFLDKFGISYVPFKHCEISGMLFDKDILIGYILEDNMGDLKTQMTSEEIVANYSCSFWGDSVIQRRLTLNPDLNPIELYNVETDNSDFLSFTNERGEGYGILFEKNRISCGKSDTHQNIILNGEWYKGRMDSANKIIERFREINPILIDSYFAKYIDIPKEKTLV